MAAKLYRSRTDRMVAGVCGGIAQYLDIDVTFVRLFFALLTLGSGIGLGVIIYGLLWVIVPYADEDTSMAMQTASREMADQARLAAENVRGALNGRNPQAGLIVGGALIALGVIFLLDNLNLFWLRWLNFDVLWPLLLVAAGAALIWRRTRGG